MSLFLFWLIPLIILLVFLLLLGGACLIDRSIFGQRCEGDPGLRYLKAEDFEDLTAEPVEFRSNRGQMLRGNLYRSAESDTCKALAIFAHGMGGGHLSYTTEINTLAKNGYLVLGYDQTGTCSSEGKNIGGFCQAVLDLRAALRFIKKDDRLNVLPVVLIGHSWGGFTVCQSLQFTKSVRAVVSLSAFEDEADLVCSLAKARIGVPIGFLKPFYRLLQWCKYRKVANRRTSSVLKEARVPALLLHGELDAVVPLEKSAASACAGKALFPSVRAVVYPGKYHNVYQSLSSEAYLNEVFGKIGSLQNKDKAVMSEELLDVYRSIDYDKITEEDPDVMRTILSFLDDHITDEPAV